MKKIVFIALLCAGCQAVSAQFDSQLNNYWAAPNYYNPAYAGESGKLELTGLYRMQWLGVQNAPKSGIILGEMPFQFFGRTHGAGVSMYNDQIGLFKTNLISGQYAFKMKLFKGNLSIGIQGGYISESFDGSQVKIPKGEGFDEQDEAIPTSEVSGNSIDAAAGLFYTDSLKRWYIGLSATHLFAPQLELNENYILDIPRSYYFSAGCNIKLKNPLLELRPSILLKTTELSSWKYDAEKDSLSPDIQPNTFKAMLKQTQLDVSLRLVYAKMLWGGLAYRTDGSMMLMLGGSFKSITAGYAYDVPVFSDLIRVTSGSHELFIKYAIDMKLKKGAKGKHKSVRLL
ncbi:MAG: type IX secretion system membrane protein PorP/SprF [Dysgonamonadaceae bacterium]|jgi:type IX secretion system PorP/SprF family membrane protein|nr:type IX secretion system membrane protein PorP/SprF [Dysgonamonadaceae bacterium]